MTQQTRDELARKVLAGILGLTDPDKALLLPLLYTPDSRLRSRVKQMDRLLRRKAAGKLTPSETQQLGYLLEEVALLVFQGLAGITSLKSYQSAGPQHDLVVAGNDSLWLCICEMLHIAKFSGILVEAKATKGKVGDKEFQRVGSIVTHHLGKTVGLGVFLSIKGATGFPSRGEKEKKLSRRAGRVTQIIVYQSAKKPIVVLDWEDIQELDKAGALITTLERKVREIEEMTGAPTALPSKPIDVMLPDRLKCLLLSHDLPAISDPKGTAEGDG